MKSRKITTAKQTSTSPVRPTGRASFAAASASTPSPTSARVASSLRARSALDDDSLKDSFSALQGRSNCSDEALEEYKRFLSLKVGALDWYAGLLSPTPEVDAVWHAHILHTMDYMDTCAVLGVPDNVRIIHHNPEGGNDERARCKRLRKASSMYQEVFGEHPSVEEDKEEEEEEEEEKEEKEEKEEEESDESDNDILTQPSYLEGWDAPSPKDDSINWVCCDICNAWRALPQWKNPNAIPERWTCSMATWDLGGAKCNKPVVDDSGGRSKTPTKRSKGGVGKVTPPPGDESITIRLKDNGGMEMHLKVKRTTRMGRVFDTYARRIGVDVSSLRFFVSLDWERIGTNDTPNSLELDDGEEIDVLLEQSGC